MPQFQNLTAEDMTQEDVLVTEGFFTGKLGQVAGSSLTTGSLTSSMKEYYENMMYAGESQFSVTFGNVNGSGSDDNIGQTKAIYESMANQLLFPDEMESIKFRFDGTNTEENVWFIIANRARMKDQINRKNWTIHLSGSHSSSYNGTALNVFNYGTGSELFLTDDSDSVAMSATPVGPRYNIVSGTLGTVGTPASTTCYGWFYPEMGIWALSGTKLAAYFPGTSQLTGSGHSTGSAGGDKGSDMLHTADLGFTLDEHQDANNHHKLVGAITASGTGITLRNQENQIVTSYFIRCKANQWNSSNNPTFSSQSLRDNTYTIKSMTGNPQSFITTVGLYDGANKLVAVGRLSAPVQKSFSDEAYIKVNIVY